MNKKKILILGGINFACEIVDEAHKMGLEVFVTDYNQNSPAKEIADKSFLISATDVEAIVKLIRQEHIDGVIFGYADVLMSSYVAVCEKAGLPCYTTEKQNQLTLDKRFFKQKCQQYGIPIVNEYSYESVVSEHSTYPIIVKPIDNSGARGIAICHNRAEFEKGYAEALEESRSKQVLIEQYITDVEATAFYYIHKKNVYLLGITDRLMLQYDKNKLPLPVGYIFPSCHYIACQEEVEHLIPTMFNGEGMQEGFVFVQGFMQNTHFVPYEMGYRLTASMENHAYEHLYGFNHMKALLRFAIGENIAEDECLKINSNVGYAANVTLLLKKGIIAEYEGLDTIKNWPFILHFFVSYPIGFEITDKQYGRLSQAGIRVVLCADTKCQLIERMERVKDTIRVIDTKGKDMVWRNYHYSNLIK